MHDIAFHKPKTYSLQVLSVNVAAQDTVEVSFDTEQKRFFFLPGQYIRIALPQAKNKKNGEICRDFSIVSSPDKAKKSITIVTRFSDGPFKQTLQSLQVGDTIQVYGPLGHFLLPEDPEVPVVMVVAGIGVAPCMSMIRWSAIHEPKRSIHLVYANEHISKAAYIDELRDYVHDVDVFELTEHIGRIDIPLLEQSVISPEQAAWYLCGPSSFVREFVSELPAKLGVPSFQIHSEEFIEFALGDPTDQLQFVSTTQIEGGNDLLQNDNVITVLLRTLDRTAMLSITDIAGNILYANRQFQEASGYSLNELLGQSNRILKSGFHDPSFYQEMWNAVSIGNVWRGEVKNRAKNGEYFWNDLTISPVYSDSRDIKQYIFVGHVVTEKKKLQQRQEKLNDMQEAVLSLVEDQLHSEAALTKAKATDDAMLSSIGEGLVYVDPAGKVMYMNRMAEQLLELEKGAASDIDWIEIASAQNEKGEAYPVEQLPANIVLQGLAPLAKSGISKPIYYRSKKGRVFPVHVTVTNVTVDELVLGAIIVFEDISQELQVDKAKTEFVSLASHQLRTPLSAINWYSESLVNEEIGSLNEEQKKYAQRIRVSNSRMTELVNALLNVSRIDMGTFAITPEKIDISEVAQTIIDEVSVLAEKKDVVLRVEMGEKLPTIFADPKLLGIVFQNLLSNAIKYTPKKGEIICRIYEKGSMIRVEVQDSGYGIPEHQQRKIFTKLFRADNVVGKEEQGTGLGLYIIKSIVDHSGGSIHFSSVENKGTTFVVDLPKKFNTREGTKELT